MKFEQAYQQYIICHQLYFFFLWITPLMDYYFIAKYLVVKIFFWSLINYFLLY